MRQYITNKFINENDFPNRLMYIGSDGKNIFRFNYETGEVYWCVEAGRWIREAPITDEDNIYVGSNDGKLYSFKKDLK